MKKIYFTLALVATGIFGLDAQNNSVLSQDVMTGQNSPVNTIIQSGVKTPSGANYSASLMGCDTLGTRWSGGNNQNGNMFDLANTSSVSIQITGFDQCFQTIGTADSVYILYKTGTFVGSEATASAWTLGAQVYMTPSVSLTPVPVTNTLNLNIPAGGTMGFYITRAGTNYVAYTNGNAQGTTLKSKNGLEFKEGRGISFPFGSAFGTSPASRIWNGVIHFCTPLITGINGVEINESENVVYPNPNSGNVNINVSTSVGINNAVVNIYDMSGRLIFSQENINNNNFTVNHGLTSGIYMLQVVNEGTIVLNKKISVQ